MTLEDKFNSAKDTVAGKAKEAEGKLSGDSVRETEGKAQGVLGKVKDKLSDAKDAVENVVDDVKDKFDKKD